MVRWSRGLGAVLTGEAGVAGWAAAELPCCADESCVWDWDVADWECEFTPFVAGCVLWVGGLEPGWVCDWVLLAVWELEPPGEEEGTPLVWGAVEDDMMKATRRKLDGVVQVWGARGAQWAQEIREGARRRGVDGRDGPKMARRCARRAPMTTVA